MAEVASSGSILEVLSMKKLMSIKEYRKTCYTENSQPSEKQIIKLIREGVLPGIKQGKFYYIDINEDNKLTRNSLVDLVLQK